MVFLRWFQLFLLQLRIVAPDIIQQSFFWLRRSQFRRPSFDLMHLNGEECSVNPRVESLSTQGSGAATAMGAAKTPGGTARQPTVHDQQRKRAFRRARRRAEQSGGTYYRGRWRTAEELGTKVVDAAKVKAAPASAGTGHSRPWVAQPRIQVRSFNVGGVTAEVYDSLCHWLRTRCEEDILILQELHWGCGRTEGSWTIPGWTFYVSANDKQRFSGVGVVVSHRIARAEDSTYCTWIPGRLLQVRCGGARATIDILAGYQWVWATGTTPATLENRSFFWNQLSRALHSIPRRNLLIVGADLNTRCQPLPGLIGRGVMNKNKLRDPELEAVLQEHNLVLLNTWGSSRPNCCHTFYHGETRSQIDFLAMRRPAADHVARRAAPYVFDLAPWRQGPKHHALRASIPWRAGWTYAKKPAVQHRFSLGELRLSIKAMDERAQKLQAEVCRTLQRDPESQTVSQMNARVLALCSKLYPARKIHASSHSQKPCLQPEVQHAVEQVWATQSAVCTSAKAVGLRASIEAWRRAAAFKQASRQLRRVSRAARKAWFEDKILEAERAASKHDLGAVYRVINHIAPKKKRDSVRIRGTRGQLLSPHAEFQEVFQHFQSEFRDPKQFDLPSCQVSHFSVEETQAAIGLLRKGKAVPSTSIPAELWLLCPQEFAQFLTPRINLAGTTAERYPPEVANCTLALLPKPNKPGRRPADLRPLGLQDPGSKVVANLLRARLQAATQEYLWAHPQYAYCPQRAIDEAISRVAKHCREVRDRVQRSTCTVHDRRAGYTPSQCVGGIMLGVDLSRAFDCVPRQALQLSLQRAGAEPELQQAVLVLHEQCKYKVTHKGHSAEFDMERGVRQGCTLSPYLFALFTCHLYDEIAQRTNTAWAQSALTLFADDTHLAWDIHSTEDLRFCMHCIRVTFEIFAQFGMTVNPTKSQLVLRLRGSAAARWLRQHKHRGERGQVWLDVGLPHQPLKIPLVATMQYLGTIVSYHGFELQTCQHRVQAALSNKHRLARILQHRQLTLGQRARLYIACIRSCLLYGQHAIGLTMPVLRKLDQFDSRVLRAIAKSPAHLLKESTVRLRQRLGTDAPQTVLRTMLERRCERIQSAECREWLQQILREMRDLMPNPETTRLLPDPTPETAVFTLGVPCPDCGVYFPSVSIMRTHRAKKHAYKGQNARTGSGRLDATTYAQGTVGGMPKCRLCGKIFSRVEALKKHINSGCEQHMQDAAPQPGATTADVDQVPTQQAESVRCRSPQVVPASTETEDISQLALLHCPQFVQQVRTDWRKAVRCPTINQKLREHCVACGQWGSRLKQHLRLMHPELWALQQAATSQCRSIGLLAASPCVYCGLVTQNPGRHLTSCIAVFQASLAHLVHTASPGPDGDGGRPDGCSGGSGPPGAGNCVRRSAVGECGVGEEAGERPGAGGRRQATQVATGRLIGEGTILQFLGRVAARKASVAECSGVTGQPSSCHGEPSNSGAGQDLSQSGGETRTGVDETAAGRGLHRFLRHVGDGVHGTPSWSGQGMGRAICSGDGQNVHQGHLGHGDDEGPPGESGKSSEGGRAVATLYECWMVPRRRDHGPGVGLPHMGSQGKETSGGRHTTTKAQRSPSPHRRPPREPSQRGRLDKVRLHQEARPSGEVHHRSCSNDAPGELERPSERSVLQCNAGPERERDRKTARSSLEARTSTSTASCKSPGGSVPRCSILRLDAEEPQRALAEADCLGRQSAGTAHEGVPVPISTSLKPFPVRLQNRTNVCYANSVLQVLMWLAEVSGTTCGALQQSRRLMRTAQLIHLPACLALQPLFRNWVGVHQQHDAGEFLAHCLAFSQAEAWQGAWEARLDSPNRAVDSGTLLQAITLHVEGETLQALVDRWHTQYALHALVQHHGLLFVQIARYTRDAKLTDVLRVRPGDSVILPVFETAEGLGVKHETFRVTALIYHLGDRVTSGHYKSLIGVPHTTTWEYFVCDDNKSPQPAKGRDLQQVDRNAYLIGLMRSL